MIREGVWGEFRVGFKWWINLFEEWNSEGLSWYRKSPDCWLHFYKWVNNVACKILFWDDSINFLLKIFKLIYKLIILFHPTDSESPTALDNPVHNKKSAFHD